MKTLEVTWRGITPIILHSDQCVNPLHPISRALKPLTSKRNKTEEDLIAISNLEWESGCYWKDDIGVYIPAENIEATMRKAATEFRKGKDVVKYIMCSDLYIPLNYGEKLTKEQLIADPQYRDVRPMTVQRAKVLRTRPRFDMWSITFNLCYDETKMDLDTIVSIMEVAGSYTGLCDSRPKYGKFAATITELD